MVVEVEPRKETALVALVAQDTLEVVGSQGLVIIG
jgi:hypothetical protein